MIREVLPDVIALVVFSTGGVLYGLLLLHVVSLSLTGLKSHVIDLGLGIFCGVLFLLLTEVYYATVVTPYTLFCYAVGIGGVLLFFNENKAIKKGKPKRLKRQKKTPKLKRKTSGNN